MGGTPTTIAITPNGSTAYLLSATTDTVTPIDTATNTPSTPIPVGRIPNGVAITPNGTTVYVSNLNDNTVTPINTATNTAGTPIPVGRSPEGIAITPNGATAYVANFGGFDNTVTPINTATNTAGTPIPVGHQPIAIAITPNGATAYVVDISGTVTPITTATNTAGTPIPVGPYPTFIAITPNGATAYVTNITGNTVTPIDTATNTAGTPIPVGAEPSFIAMTPNGLTAYVTNYVSNTVTPIDTATNTAGTPISVGAYPEGIAITPDQAPVAHLSVSPAEVGQPTGFDASASTVAFGTISTYAWNFGDGSTTTTSTPTTTHTYATSGPFTATVTETDSAGTSTTQVFTGQTVSRNGGPSAVDSRTFTVPSLVPTTKQQCMNGGWQTLTNAAGQPFRNQGQCIAFALHHPVSLADLTNPSFAGVQTSGGLSCPQVHQAFDAVYPGSAAVGNVALHIDGCADVPNPQSTYAGSFTITTGAGTLSGSASGPVALQLGSPILVLFDITLAINAGTGVFAGTTGSLLFSTTFELPQGASIVGSVSVP